MSRVMLLMRLVTLSPYFFPSFLPLSPLFTAPWSGHSRWREGTSHWKGMVIVWRPARDRSSGRAAIYFSCFRFQTFTGDFTFFFVFSVEEEEARSMRGGHILGHVSDFKVVNETPEEQQEACEGG